MDSRVVGGVDALPNQIPYIASLRRRVNGNHFCGSSIIKPRWVLSAAHCTEDFEPADMFVVVGSILLSSGGVEHEVSQIINHPEYSRDLLTADISLVQVQTAFTFNAAVQPVLVGSEYISEANAVVSGWGLTNVSAKINFNCWLWFIYLLLLFANLSTPTISCRIIYKHCRPGLLRTKLVVMVIPSGMSSSMIT